MNKPETNTLGAPKQVRFPKDVEADLQKIVDANPGLEWAAAARLAISFGVPILRKRLSRIVKEAAA